MKFTLSLIFALFICINTYSQDIYKKRYYVKGSIKYRVDNSTFKDSLVVLKSKNGVIPKEIRDILNSKGLKSNVIFEEDSDTLWVNPWLVKSKNRDYLERETIYYYTLKNRQSLKICFKQWSLNVLTVPLKIRFGDETEFSTGANLGALIGHTWGKTNFLHRKKVGNKQYDSKFTLGLFLGADKLEFSFKNNNSEDENVKSAFVSTGLGALYSYQSFSFGLTSGFDFGLGKNSSEWNYQGKPWLGISLGYSLFSF